MQRTQLSIKFLDNSKKIKNETPLILSEFAGGFYARFQPLAGFPARG
jgi:hypothetical protein